MKPIQYGQLKAFPRLLIAIMGVTVAMSAASSIVGTELRPSIQLNGTVTDAMCGRTHRTQGQSDADCTRACAELGAGYALVVGKKLYFLRGDQAELNEFAADQVQVTGKVIGRDTVAVESVVPWTVEVSCHTGGLSENCK